MTARVERGLASAIVALNPHDHDFEAVLDAWAAQVAAGDYEVIVVNDGCRATLASEYARHRLRFPSTPVSIVASVAPGRAASNNAGVRASRGDLLLFVADDFRPSAGLVAAHRAFHESIGRPAVGIGPGYFDATKRADPFIRWLEDSGRIWGIAFASAGLRWRGDFFYVGNASMPRTVFEVTGAFDERFRNDLFDDWEFAQRLRATVATTDFVSRAIAWHDHDVTLEERLVAARRWGECMARYENTLGVAPPWPAAGVPPVEDLRRIIEEQSRRPSGRDSFAARTMRWTLELAAAVSQGYHGSRTGEWALGTGG